VSRDEVVRLIWQTVDQDAPALAAAVDRLLVS
jgi:hypothetical protein